MNCQQRSLPFVHQSVWQWIVTVSGKRLQSYTVSPFCGTGQISDTSVPRVFPGDRGCAQLTFEFPWIESFPSVIQSSNIYDKGTE